MRVLKLSIAFGALISLMQPSDWANAGQDSKSFTITSVPREMSYQGILKDSGGNPVADSIYGITFRIFDIASGGMPLWNQTLPCTTSAGFFDAALGNVNLPFDEDYWLELEIHNEILDPRQKLKMVGYAAVSDTADYAQRVATVDGATGGTILGNVNIQSNLAVAGDISASGKATIGPGHTNTGSYAFVAGNGNTANNTVATVSGGQGNTAGLQAAVGGGINNQATGQYSTVAGGGGNAATGHGTTIGGGFGNQATSDYACVGGGWSNIAGTMATVPGGRLNTASGQYSFAAGYRAKATHNGSFVWADSYDANFSSGGQNEFSVRASGGTRIYSNTSLSAGVVLYAGTSSWSSVSDNTLIRNIRSVDGKEILDGLASIPITRWSYEAQDPSIEHIGPMAQDFYGAFGLGEDERYISTIDADGIALAAIQRLYKITQDQQAEIDALSAQLSEAQKTLLLIAAGTQNRYKADSERKPEN